jgi:hypothetical protein
MKEWMKVFLFGLFVITGVTLAICAFISIQESKNECARKGGTWVETEFTSKCLDVKEVK